MSDTTYALTIVPAAKIVEMDRIASGYQAALANNTTQFARALITAQAMQQLRALMTPEVMRPVMELMNSDLGFLTDRDPRRPRWNSKLGKMESVAPYTEDVVRDCLISGTLQGLQWVGNELNIISGKCYTTKNGLTALLKKLRGLQNLVISYGVPKVMTGGAIVPVAATWSYNGVKGALVGIENKPFIEIPVKVNDAMGADAILGKAERKAKARIYAQITGSEVAEGDIEDVFAAAKPVAATSVLTVAAGSALDGLGPLAQQVQPIAEDAPPAPPVGEDGGSFGGDEGTATPPPVEPATTPAPETTQQSPAEPVQPPAAAAQPATAELANEVMRRLKDGALSSAKFMDWCVAHEFAPKGAQSPLDIPEKNLRKIINAWPSVVSICGKKA